MSLHLLYLLSFLSSRGLLHSLMAVLSNTPRLQLKTQRKLRPFIPDYKNVTGMLTAKSSAGGVLCASPSVNQLETTWEQIPMAVSLRVIYRGFCLVLPELLVLAHSRFVPVLGRVSPSGAGTYWIWLATSQVHRAETCDSSPASLDFVLCLLVLTTSSKLMLLEALDLLSWDLCCISTTAGCGALFWYLPPLIIKPGRHSRVSVLGCSSPQRKMPLFVPLLFD